MKIKETSIPAYSAGIDLKNSCSVSMSLRIPKEKPKITYSICRVLLSQFAAHSIITSPYYPRFVLKLQVITKTIIPFTQRKNMLTQVFVTTSFPFGLFLTPAPPEFHHAAAIFSFVLFLFQSTATAAKMADCLMEHWLRKNP